MSGTLTDKNLAISGDEFARLMELFAPWPATIALAVSGGPDSMALAFCVKRWGQCEVIAFVVDHGLRAEAATEAKLVKTRLESMGIRAEILRWDHEPVAARIHERAREARYHLLTDACLRHGVNDVLTAHHRDDQAETILMRLAKGSGIEGLAGMAGQSYRKNIRLLRPFLPLPKERLIATCIAEKISYVTDPSNGSVLFARGRLRNIMPLLAREGMTTDNLSQLGWRAAETKDALDHYTKEFLRSVAQEKVGGSICLDRSALRLVPRAIGLRALSACLRHIHPADYPPEYGPLSALLNTILEATEDTARTFYGCIASLTASKVTILREPSAISEILPLHAGETVLWDKRWLVTANAAATPTIIQAMGSLPHEEIDRLAPGLRRQIPQGRIRASLPSIWIGGQRLAIPSFDEKAPFHLAYRKQAFP